MRLTPRETRGIVTLVADPPVLPLFSKAPPALTQEVGIRACSSMNRIGLSSARRSSLFRSWLTLMTHLARDKARSKTRRVLGAHSTLLTGSLIANSLGRDRKLSITKASATVSLLPCPLWVRSGALAKAERRGESRPLGCLLSPWIEASIGTSNLHTYRLFDSGGTCSLGELWPRSLGNLWSLASFR
jgi:hypothetical protein